MVFLVCDIRESAVTKYSVKKSTKKEKLDVGDYHIRDENKIYYVIERKTWKDLAASIIDKRYGEQKKQLIQAQEKSPELKIFYIIEGVICSENDKLVGKIPFKTLETAKRHLLISGFYPISTKNPEHTMRFLEDLVGDLEDKELKGGAEKVEKKPKQIIDFARSVWEKHKSVGRRYSEELLYISIYDFYKDFEIKSDKIPAKIANKISDAAQIPKKEDVKILAELPGISLSSAKFILNSITLREFILSDNISEIKKTDKTKIGNKKAEEIKSVINFKIEN